jgi:hypothetical protein
MKVIAEDQWNWLAMDSPPGTTAKPIAGGDPIDLYFNPELHFARLAGNSGEITENQLATQCVNGRPLAVSCHRRLQGSPIAFKVPEAST